MIAIASFVVEQPEQDQELADEVRRALGIASVASATIRNSDASTGLAEREPAHLS